MTKKFCLDDPKLVISYKPLYHPRYSASHYLEDYVDIGYMLYNESEADAYVRHRSEEGTMLFIGYCYADDNLPGIHAAKPRQAPIILC